MVKSDEENLSEIMETADNSIEASQISDNNTHDELVNEDTNAVGSNKEFPDSEMLIYNVDNDIKQQVHKRSIENNDKSSPDKEVLAKKIRRNRIIESDSEEELSETNNDKEDISAAQDNQGDTEVAKKAILNSEDDEDAPNREQPKKKAFKLINSDRDDDSTLVENVNGDNKEPMLETETNDTCKEKHKKPFKLIDSDSEPDSEDIVQRNDEPVYTLNSKKELVPEKSLAESLAELCDGESSEDEDRRRKPLAYKKKSTKRGEESHERKMTPREAAAQRKEIESVSQKMVRESQVSLPYHKPKQRSLKEFMQQRPRFASAIPDEIRKGSIGGIKMSTDQLLIVSKKIEERQKQVEEFYRSESEEEVEPAVNIEKHEESSVNTEMNIEDTETKIEALQKKTSVEESTMSGENGGVSSEKDEEVPTLMDVAMETNENLQELASVDDIVIESNQHETNINISNNSEYIEKDASVEYESNVFDSDDEEDEIVGNEITKLVKYTAEEALIGKVNIADDGDDNCMKVEEHTAETKENDKILQEEHLFAQENNETIRESNEEPSYNKKIEVLSHFKVNLPTRDGILLNIQPKLSGAPNYLIDLDEGTTKLNEVTELMQRFAKHACKKPLHKKPSAVELNVMCVSQGGEVHQEKVAMKVDEPEQPPIEEKPGVQLQKLRNNLQKQMAQKREEVRRLKELRLQKEKEEQEEDDAYNGEKDDCGIDDILDDEEEEFSDIESTDEEDDDEEEQQNADAEREFIEGEAEEDGIKGEEDEGVENGKPNYEEADNEPEENEIITKTKNVSSKALRRIIQPVDDSDSDEDVTDKINEEKSTQVNPEEGPHMDSTVSWPDDDDALVPAGQTNSCRTPIKQHAVQSKSELGFLSPVCRLTGLQSFDATGKFLQNSPGSPAIQLGEPSPFKNNTWSKSLFEQSPLKSSDITVEDSADKTNNSSIMESQLEPSTQDLMELCSGNFGFTQSDDTVTQKEATPKESLAKDGFNSTRTNKDIIEESKSNIKEKDIIIIGKQTEEAKIDEDDDRFISQLIDEEELATFKKKFESPCEVEYNKTFPDSVIAAKIRFHAEKEAEEEDDDDDINITTRGKQNKIVDTDEEEDDADLATTDCDNVIDLHDDVGDELEEDLNEEEEDINKDETELGYDSEENEVVIEKPKKKMRMKDFLENEAELSESEWGSEDEDEGHLDIMEMEEGDKDKFNANKLRRELERIHMRQILDKDKREIKALQELLMDEDEELAGAGRQRQFKWRNIDNVENLYANNLESDLIHQEEEEENEEEWRKKRHERELFLQSQKESQDQEDDSNEVVPLIAATSQVFKLGQRAVIKNKFSLKKTFPLINTKQAYTLNTQRGSFLSRKDEVLTRVAEFSKVADMNIGTAKHSRNFIFQTVEKTASIGSSSTFEDKKRKAADAGTPAQLKRLRLNGLSPAAQQKKTDSRSKARLFNNSQW